MRLNTLWTYFTERKRTRRGRSWKVNHQQHSCCMTEKVLATQAKEKSDKYWEKWGPLGNKNYCVFDISFKISFSNDLFSLLEKKPVDTAAEVQPQRASYCAKTSGLLCPKIWMHFPLVHALISPGIHRRNTRHSNYFCSVCFLRSFFKSHLSFPPHLSSFACGESESKARTSVHTVSGTGASAASRKPGGNK